MTDLTPDRLARLRRLADLARGRSVDSDAVTLFAAGVSPDVVTALLDEIERLRAIVEDVAAEGAPVGIGDWCAWCGAESPGHKPDCAWLKVKEATRG